MGKGKRSSTAQMASGSSKMTFDEFFDKYKYDNGISYSAYLDVPLERAREFKEQGLNPNTTFQLWLDDANDYGTPDVVSNSELDKLVESGATEIFRGMPDSDRSSGDAKLSQVMNDDKYYAGKGIYGDGLYFAGSLDVAGSYAADYEAGTGSVMRAVLKPGAKVISYDDAHALMRKELPNTFMTNSDLSAWARSKGYDVITADPPPFTAPNGQKVNVGRYYNVINRGAIVMGRTLGKVKGGSDGGTIQF